MSWLRRWWAAVLPLAGAAAYALAVPGSSWVLEDNQFFGGTSPPYAAAEATWWSPWFGTIQIYIGGHPSWRPLPSTWWLLVRDAVGGLDVESLRYSSVVLLIGLVVAMLAAGRRLGGPAIALALLLVAHPHTPHVAGWISDAPDLWAGVGLALALALPGPAGVALGVFAAMTSKETLITAPFLPALILAAGGRPWRSALGAGIVAGAAWFAGYLAVAGFPAVGTHGSDPIAALRALLSGTGAVVLAAPCAPLTQPLPPWSDSTVIVGGLVLAAGAALVARGSRLGAPILVFAVAFAPAAWLSGPNGFLPLRYGFPPLVAALLTVAAVLPRPPRWSALALGALVLVYVPVTAANLAIYHNDESTWGTEHARHPTANSAVGLAHELIKDPARARAGLRLWREGLEMPDAETAVHLRKPLRREWYHLANTAARKGAWEDAVYALGVYDARSTEEAAEPEKEKRLRCMIVAGAIGAGVAIKDADRAVLLTCAVGGAGAKGDGL